MKKMNKVSLAVLAGASALACSQVSRAALTIADTVTPDVAINGSTFDLVDFYLTGLTGPDTAPGVLSSDGGILGLDGTFTDNTGNGIAVPGSATTWTSYIAAGGDGALPAGTDSSLVNLDSVTTATRSGTGTTTTSKGKVTGVTGTSNSFGATWFTTDAAIVPNSDTTGTFGANLIAQIYVVPGSVVTFNGSYVSYGVNGGPVTFSNSAASATSTGPSNVTGSNKIISLVTSGAPTGTPPNGYGSAPAGPTLDVHTGTAAFDTFPAPGVTTGFVAVTGENPSSNTELYALQLDLNGVPISPSDTADLNKIIADIDASSTTATASLLSASPYAGAFPPGYDLLITTSAGSASPFFAWDFSSAASDFTDSDTALGAVTVTGIAAVPEPASAVGIFLGASGLLLGRRKNRIQSA